MRIVDVKHRGPLQQRKRLFTRGQGFVFMTMMFGGFNAVLLAAMFGFLDIPGYWLFFGILGMGLVAVFAGSRLKPDP